MERLFSAWKRLRSKAAWRYELLLERTGRRRYERGQDRTFGWVKLADVGFDHPERVSYMPSGWSIARRAMRGLPVGDTDVFLDLGSGKGRVVTLVARRYSFARVIGVEVVPEFTEHARANLERVRQRLRSRDVELLTTDATEYRVPDDVTHVFMFNPFGGVTFQRVFDRLIESLDRRPRRIFLMYVNPKLHDHVIDSGRFRLVRSSGGPFRGRQVDSLNVYESVEAPGLSPQPAAPGRWQRFMRPPRRFTRRRFAPTR